MRAAPLLGGCAVLLALVAAGVVVARTATPEPAARLLGHDVGLSKAAAPPATRPAPPEAAGEPADFSELVAEVAAVRGLSPHEPVVARVLSPADLAAKVAALDFGDDDAAQVEGDRRLLVTLRLIPPDLDLLGLVRDLYAEQVLGIYLPEEATLYVGTGDATLTPYEEVTAAHEITHALQDQAFGLEPLRDLPDVETDASLALHALIEGDAVVTQTIWQARNQTAAERADARADVGTGSNEVLQRSPPYVRASLAFPYVEGAAFVGRLLEDGGFARIDAAYAAPPTTTEQILHPERYVAGEVAVPIEVTSDAGVGWTQTTTAELGEFDLRQLLVSLGRRRAADVANGWGGGQVVAWHPAASSTVMSSDATAAVAAALTFDTPADAAQACTALPEWYAAVASGISTATTGLYQGDRDLLAVACDELEVRLGIAPDAATAQRLANR